MDWAGRMNAVEDKMAQYNVYWLGSNNLFFLYGFLVQVLLPSLAKSQFSGAFTRRRETHLSALLRPSLSVCLSVTGRIRVKFCVRDFWHLYV
jgi:hypothetical protein